MEPSLKFLDPNPQGKGVILLLHGLGVDGSSWDYQLEGLSRMGYRPIAPDLPGFGDSPNEGKSWNIHLVSEKVIQWMTSNTDEKMVLVGHSMGGVIAQEIALYHPEKICGLILVNTFAHLRPKHASEWLYFGLRYLTVNFQSPVKQAELVARRVFPHPEQEWLRKEAVRRILTVDPVIYRSAMRELFRFDSRSNLKNLSMPVLVITGEGDTTIRMDEQAELVKLVSGARQVVIPGGGHGVIVEKPDEVNAAMIQFLKFLRGWDCE